MFCIGPYRLRSRVLLAPMAGITDAPFRKICQQMGAGLTTSEMLTAKTSLWDTKKSSQRLTEISDTQPVPRSIQIAGSEPAQMAEAAKACVDNGAEIVDINMGCPAKKVCNKAAGSALLRDEKLVEDILVSVVNAVSIPVTLKIRTGWCPDSRNGITVARIAENAGIQALTVHGRTRACRFVADAEYQTIADIVNAVSIPVIANGDIDSPALAKQVLKYTNAQAVMVGRSIQGQPWLIQEIDHFLKTDKHLPPLALDRIAGIISEHLSDLYRFYGDFLGVRIARKHIKWYLQGLADRLAVKLDAGYLKTINNIESPDLQHASVQQAIERLINREEFAA